MFGRWRVRACGCVGGKSGVWVWGWGLVRMCGCMKQDCCSTLHTR